MVAALMPGNIDTIITCAPNSPRALPATEVAEAARALGIKTVVGGPVVDALALAEPIVKDDGMLLVAGSLYVVTEARELLKARSKPGRDSQPSH